MDFLSKFDVGQIVGLILIFSAAFDKFFVMDLVLKKIGNPGFQSEDEIKKTKKILTIGINSSSAIIALLGFAFLIGIIKI